MSTSSTPTSGQNHTHLSPFSGLSVLGVRAGYSHQIGVLVSQLAWMRAALMTRLTNLTLDELDWLPAPDGNTVGALLLHLAATETYYQFHTFKGLPWPTTSPETKRRFGPAMRLGDLGRARIKGNDRSFYIDTLTEVRETTLAELANRDDSWLMSVDANWFWGPTNNLCKWFHVCEHESHHCGQIDIHLKSYRAGLRNDSE